MSDEIEKSTGNHISPFERIRRTNEAGNEYWSSRDLANVLEYTQYRNFETVIEEAKLACFNSGQRIEDHFADVNKMVEIGSGAIREIKETDRLEKPKNPRSHGKHGVGCEFIPSHPGRGKIAPRKGARQRRSKPYSP